MNVWAQLPSWLQALVWASLTGTVLAAGVVCVEWLLRRRVPARWRLGLWLIVLVRLAAVPLPASSWSVFNWIPARVPAVQTPAPVAPAAPPLPLATVEVPIDSPDVTLEPAFREALIKLAQDPSRRPPPAPADLMPPDRPVPWGLLAAALYVLGAGALGVRFLVETWLLNWKLRGAKRVEDACAAAALAEAKTALGIRRNVPLLASDAVGSPALAGYFRPRLLLPPRLLAVMSREELRLMFLHECAHLRRGDVLLNYVVMGLAALHWFNPAVWLVVRRISAAQELACDETVLWHVAEPARYGHLLLKLLEEVTAGRSPVAVRMIERRSFFARRIEMIARFRKSPRWVAVAAVAGLVAVGACALTNAQSAPGTPNTVKTEGAAGANTASAVPPAYRADAPIFRGVFIRNDTKEAYATLEMPVSNPQTRTVEVTNGNFKPGDAIEWGGAAYVVQAVSLEKGLVVEKDGKTITIPVGYNLLNQAAAPLGQAIVAVPAMPTRNGPRTPAANAAAAARANLDEPVKELVCDQQSLEKILQFLRDNMDANLVVNWAALEAVGVERSTPVTVSLKDVPFRKVLRTVLDLAAGGAGRVDYQAEDAVIAISSVQDLAQQARMVARWDAERQQLKAVAEAAPQPPAAGVDNAQSQQDAFTIKTLQNTKMTWEQEKRAEESKASPSKARLAAIDDRLKQLDDQIKQLSDNRAAGEAQRQKLQVLSEMLNTKANLEKERADLAQRIGPNATRLKDIDAHIAAITRQIEGLQVTLAAQADVAKKREDSLITRTHDAWMVYGALSPNKPVLDADQRAAVDDLVKSLRQVLKADETVTAVNGMIIVKADREGQDKVNDMLRMLEEQSQKRWGTPAPGQEH
jgi:beta-lactamase regulating signal transducer with metallopeptidase domain